MEKIKDILSKALSSLFGNLTNVGFLVAFFLLAVSFVSFRMKSVEQDYELNQVNKDFGKASLLNKELKAEKALLLSSSQIKKMAKDHNLKAPGPQQIIVIPE